MKLGCGPCLHRTPEYLTDDVLPFGELHCKCSRRLAVAGSREVLPLATGLEAHCIPVRSFYIPEPIWKRYRTENEQENEEGAESSFLGNEWEFIQANFVPQIGCGEMSRRQAQVLGHPPSPSAGVKGLELSSRAPAGTSRGGSPLGRFSAGSGVRAGKE